MSFLSKLFSAGAVFQKGMVLDRACVYGDEGFWIRQAYRELFQQQLITAVVRMGDRSNPSDFRHIRKGVPIPVRFIIKPGIPKKGIKGDLFPDDGTTIERTECIVKRIGELTLDDLQGTAPDTATSELVRYHLATINNSSLPSMDTVITIWRFTYLPKTTL
jgi:hypothetical protein